ncbi:MAG TPA: hypothetical protein O0X39_03540 [Methanocorpusculum sp.]|nr:hypothetical protein [Methanocorpusculum sp.]
MLKTDMYPLTGKKTAKNRHPFPEQKDRQNSRKKKHKPQLKKTLLKNTPHQMQRPE